MPQADEHRRAARAPEQGVPNVREENVREEAAVEVVAGAEEAQEHVDEQVIDEADAEVVIATLHTDLVHNLLVPLMSYVPIKPSSSTQSQRGEGEVNAMPAWCVVRLQQMRIAGAYPSPPGHTRDILALCGSRNVHAHPA